MKNAKFTVAQVTALCGGTLPYANGFPWGRVEYFLFEEGAFQPYSNGTILPGPGLTPCLDHWDDLARRLRQYMKQVTDERLNELYRKLYAAGWTERPFPLSTRNADCELKYLLMEYVSVETIERREGRVPSVT